MNVRQCARQVKCQLNLERQLLSQRSRARIWLTDKENRRRVNADQATAIARKLTRLVKFTNETTAKVFAAENPAVMNAIEKAGASPAKAYAKFLDRRGVPDVPSLGGPGGSAVDSAVG